MERSHTRQPRGAILPQKPSHVKSLIGQRFGRLKVNEASLFHHASSQDGRPFQAHVLVEAYEIAWVCGPDADGAREIRVIGASDNHRLADAGMLARYTPVPGDYWVEQEDGYVYLNPKATFKRKYSPVVNEAGSTTATLEPGQGLLDPSQAIDPVYAERLAASGHLAPLPPKPFTEAWRLAASGHLAPLPPKPFTEAWVAELTRYHQPTPDGVSAMGRVRAAASAMMWTICEHCPPSADRTTAIRHVRDAMMTANASIALNGLV